MVNYKIIRSSRKTIAIQITAGGGVLVRCPKGMSMEAIGRFVDSKTGWIEKHMAKSAENPRYPKLTADELEALILQARKTICQRVAYYAPLVGVNYGRITIRSQRSRWGSCSGKGNLNFNCLLMLAPPEVLDYVVVHELCHRKELNHSRRFWAEVEKILPDYRERRRWLKENSGPLIQRLPNS